jgi:hypothetical protein
MVLGQQFSQPQWQPRLIIDGKQFGPGQRVFEWSFAISNDYQLALDLTQGASELPHGTAGRLDSGNNREEFSFVQACLVLFAYFDTIPKELGRLRECSNDLHYIDHSCS